MHIIRRNILKKLILAPVQKYAELKPGEVEGNLFTYHLKGLVRDGLIQKRQDGLYQLTAQGKLYADRLSMETLTIRAQPKIVTLLVVRNAYGEYLLYRRLKQPLFGKVGFPYGKLHLGESLAKSAERELKEKTGLSAALSHRGDGYITVNEHHQPISHIMFHLFVGTDTKGELKPKSPAGENLWSRLHYLDPPELMPGVLDIARTLDKNPMSRFFAEFNYDLDPEVPDILEV